jgi:tetratricopeptide (TPR) repeat protein
MAGLLLPLTSQAQDAPLYDNLLVLPQNISRDELGDVMLQNLLGLGLPRRQNEGCLFCHVGDMDQPRSSWAWASDDKAPKRTARVMMEMVRDINASLLGLEDRVAPGLEVTCATCHAGRTDPRPLPEVLEAAYVEAGIEGTIQRYRVLRDRYFGANAYDFRIGVLADLAAEFARDGAYEDGMRLMALNEEVHPGNATARRSTIALQLIRAAGQNGVTQTLEDFDVLREGEPAGVINPGVLDGLGWYLFRTDRRDDAVGVFRRNLELFAGHYIPNESLADALNLTGDRDTAISMFEGWLALNPDHAMARRRLADLRAN